MGMSFASTAGQGWEYMQRSEMSPIVKGAGTIRAYADWKRVVYTLHVGKSVASFSESRGGGSGEQERLMLRFVAEKMNAEATIRSLDASGSMSCGSFQVSTSTVTQMQWSSVGRVRGHAMFLVLLALMNDQDGLGFRV